MANMNSCQYFQAMNVKNFPFIQSNNVKKINRQKKNCVKERSATLFAREKSLPPAEKDPRLIPGNGEKAAAAFLRVARLVRQSGTSLAILMRTGRQPTRPDVQTHTHIHQGTLTVCTRCLLSLFLLSTSTIYRRYLSRNRDGSDGILRLDGMEKSTLPFTFTISSCATLQTGRFQARKTNLRSLLHVYV